MAIWTCQGVWVTTITSVTRRFHGKIRRWQPNRRFVQWICARRTILLWWVATGFGSDTRQMDRGWLTWFVRSDWKESSQSRYWSSFWTRTWEVTHRSSWGATIWVSYWSNLIKNCCRDSLPPMMRYLYYFVLFAFGYTLNQIHQNLTTV